MNKRVAGLCLLLSLTIPCPGGWAGKEMPVPKHVTVSKTAKGWHLLVDGKPFHVKGVVCAASPGQNGEDYLLMAKEMGANAVRTRGDNTRAYFDKAGEYDLMVDAGIWFNPDGQDFGKIYQNRSYRRRLKEEVLNQIRKLKDHPALLCWNLGDEVFSKTPDGAERQAFGEFLNDLIQAVHKEDPNHPVAYASDATSDLFELKDDVPDLDIVGINTHADLSSVFSWMERNDFNKPVIVTEFGAKDVWQLQKDPNGITYDPLDQDKAADFSALWQQSETNPARSLGGFAFILGEQRNTYSLTWFNVNFGDLRRQPYWTLYKLYTGLEPPSHCPKISFLKLDKTSGIHPGESIKLTVEAADPDGNPLAYRYFVTDIMMNPALVEAAHYFPVEVTEEGPGVAHIKVPKKLGTYRVYVQVTNDHKNTAIANRSIQVEPVTN